MYVIGSLTQNDWAKIQGGLAHELQQVRQAPPDATVSALARFVPCLDLWVTASDGQQHWIRAVNYPSTWTKADWINFVVTLAKNPKVSKVGMLCENPVQQLLINIGLSPSGESSPNALLYAIDNASTAPPSGGTGTIPGSGSGLTPTAGVGGMNLTAIALIAGAGLLLISIMKRR